ncbi:hypothetical protein NEMIN01_1734 [Nematocida minor]|uniref:uncharacterized protein n=1 Tax=Nematocida minor TaxID=1912983 RepID=UPI002220CAC7|nr:uncharacterized protein NEMIN01_1734 [Nematocida minor]KAI5191916.1 hypothetical protein NEMIN01_1734 [Nematocida minor]
MNSVKERKPEEQQDNRKKNQKLFKFQGVGKHLSVLRECTAQIKEIEEKVAAKKQRLDARIEEFRKATGQKELYDTKDEIQKKIEEIQKEKGTMGAELKQAVQELKTLSHAVGEEKKKLNMKSTSELRNKLSIIDNRIIERPLSSKEEKDISTEKNRIIKLLAMQDIFKEKDEKIKEMEDQKKKKEAAFSIKKQELDLQIKKLAEINSKLGKIKKTAYSEDIKKMQGDIAALIEEKKSLFEEKKNEIVVMEKKEKEYELKSAEIETAKKHKMALFEQEKVISDLMEQREKLESDLHSNPSEQLKSISSALRMQKMSVQKGRAAKISLPFHLVSQLVKFNIPIPKTSADIETTLQKIEEIFQNEENTFLSKKQQISAKIAQVNEKIKSEKEAHQKMPRPVFPRISE